MRVLVIALLSAAAGIAQGVRVQDRIALPIDPSKFFDGDVLVSAECAMTWAGVPYAKWSKSFSISNGYISLSLIPTIGAEPKGCYYTADFKPKSGKNWSETWVVANTGAPVKVSAIRWPLGPPTPSARMHYTQIDWGNLTGCINIQNGVPESIACGSTTGTRWVDLAPKSWTQVGTLTWLAL